MEAVINITEYSKLTKFQKIFGHKIHCVVPEIIDSGDELEFAWVDACIGLDGDTGRHYGYGEAALHAQATGIHAAVEVLGQGYQ